MQPVVGVALAGDDADLAAAVAVEHPAAEDAFEQGAVVVGEHLGGCDDRVGAVRRATRRLQPAGEQDGSAGVGLDDLGASLCEGAVEGVHAGLGEGAAVEPHRLAGEGAVEAGAERTGWLVARGAPDDGGAVADLPPGPAVVPQRGRRPRAFAVAAEEERDRRAGRAAGLVADQVSGRPALRDHVAGVFLDVALLEDRQMTQVGRGAQVVGAEAGLLEAPAIERAPLVGVPEQLVQSTPLQMV